MHYHTYLFVSCFCIFSNRKFHSLRTEFRRPLDHQKTISTCLYVEEIHPTPNFSNSCLFVMLFHEKKRMACAMMLGSVSVQALSIGCRQGWKLSSAANGEHAPQPPAARMPVQYCNWLTDRRIGFFNLFEWLGFKKKKKSFSGRVYSTKQKQNDAFWYK